MKCPERKLRRARNTIEAAVIVPPSQIKIASCARARSEGAVRDMLYMLCEYGRCESHLAPYDVIAEAARLAGG